MNNKLINTFSLLMMAVLFSCQVQSHDEGAYEPGHTEVELPATIDLESSKDTPEDTPEVNYFVPYNSFSEESDWVKQIWGQPFRNRINVGMWTLHFSSGDDQENTNNLLGGVYKGYYVGTFVNTHRDQVYSAGWQRALYRDKWGVFDVEAGYRAGIMYGYTKYLKLGNTKLFPLFQTLLDIDYNGFGVELSWAGVVATAGFYYRF